MSGKLQRAGADILRRATALGLVGLTVALFVGVMAFALTTSPAGQTSESSAQYLATANRIANLTTVATSRLQQIDASGLIPLSVASAAEFSPELSTTPYPLLMTRTAALEHEAAATDTAARSVEAPTVEPQPLTALEPAEPVEQPEPAAPTITVLRTAPGVAPNLEPGEHWEATVSFYYCEQGSRGRHPGDGGLFCGHMRNGEIVYDGAAACEYKYLGQRFRILGDPTQRIYTCADTGNAVLGLHRDIWFHNSDDGWDWQLIVGQVATIEIVD